MYVSSFPASDMEQVLTDIALQYHFLSKLVIMKTFS